MSATTRSESNVPTIFGFLGATLLGMVLVATLIMSNLSAPRAQAANEPSPTTRTSTPTSTTPADAACEPQYTQYKAGAPEGAGNEDGQVVSDFEIRYATATAEASSLDDAQRSLLIDETAKNAQALAAWAHAFGLYDDPNALAPLINGTCLSSEGQMLHAQFKGALSANGTTFEEAEAPATAYNSGVSNGVYGVASEAGIRGDRKAIKVTLPDGSTVYIMVRCGNPVYPGKPNLPEVPTDNPPPPPPPNTPVCEFNPALPPDSPNCVKPKNPTLDPFVRGNAPDGGGRNADPGPGVSIPPAQMEQPPTTPRVDPAPPAPQPPAPAPSPSPGSTPTPVPTPDPAPAPEPEPSAPPPSAPETECVPIPGVMDC